MPDQTDATWIDLCGVDELPADGGHYVVHDDRPYAVFRHDDGIVVIDDTCPHAGGSLSGGAVDDTGCVLCPWHGWPFRLSDGRCPDNPTVGVRRYDVRVVDDRIRIRV